MQEFLENIENLKSFREKCNTQQNSDWFSVHLFRKTKLIVIALKFVFYVYSILCSIVHDNNSH